MDILDNKKNPLPQLGIKPHFLGCPAHSLVTIPTRLSATSFPIHYSLIIPTLNIVPLTTPLINKQSINGTVSAALLNTDL
jgi:hypothetical protein